MSEHKTKGEVVVETTKEIILALTAKGFYSNTEALILDFEKISDSISKVFDKSLE